MSKRLISFLLIICMLSSILPVSAIAADSADTTKAKYDALLANPFTDVEKADWFFDAVQYVRINSIFNGTSDTVFSPYDSMTRGMFVTVLGRMAGVHAQDYTGKSVFADVSADAYYAPYVAWASKYGITQGTDTNKFSPDLPINRQQMATFFVRYFDAFSVAYEAEEEITSLPADMDTVADWAKGAVEALWKKGLLNGDGTSFSPEELATRSQAAALCTRTDSAVEAWYREPGTESDRIRLNPETGKPFKDSAVPLCAVYFYDGTRLIDILYTEWDAPLEQLPAVEKSSKDGAVLLGYYLDPEFTKPFYAHEPVTNYTTVYAKYQTLDSHEFLNLNTFAKMDQEPSYSLSIRRVSGSVAPENAATLTTKDGSDPVGIAINDPDGDGVYTVYAPAGFVKGCTYELALADGWIFDGKADTIRSASFSIKMAEVENLRMSDDIVYIPDVLLSEAGTPVYDLSYTINYSINETPGSKNYTVLKADALSVDGADMSSISGCFTYPGSVEIEAGDLLCVYVGLHPNERIARSNDNDPTNDGALMDPAVYVKVQSVSNDGLVTFVPMSDKDQEKLYEVPDLFPFLVKTLPSAEAESLSIDIDDLDLSFYETSMGKVDGTVAKAREKASVRDFVVLYTDLTANPEPGDLFYGRITAYDSISGRITYTPCTEADLLNCMDLYSVVDIQGYDLVSEQQQQALQNALYAQVDESGFAEEAAYLLADLVTKTDGFRDDLNVQNMLLTDSEGNRLTQADIQLMNLGGGFELTDDVKLTVELITGGDQLHFNKGVQLAIGVDASFEVDAEDGKVAIDLSATFVQEVSVIPSVKGSLTHTKILGIKIPNGVQVNASIDVKSYTALSFDAEIYTVADEDASLWEQMQALVNDPTSVLGLSGIPSKFAGELATVSDVLDKIDELQNAIDRGTLAYFTAIEYARDVHLLWDALEANDLADRDDWEELGNALGKTHITSELMDLVNLTNETGLSTEYYNSLDALVQKYSETVTKETDWIKLLEEEIFATEVCVSGICIGVEVSFVVRADMSIAIGSNLEYEVGKRYSFWFKIGLYTPTAGSDVTDLIDEHFAFQFYVMGKLGVKAGVRAKLYAGIGSKAIASVGIAAELGPYIKLYGFFVYEYSKYRPANTQNWTYTERMAGALYMEFGLYFMLSFEAEALSLFEYSHDFLDEEIPLLTSGEPKVYYRCNYMPERDELIVVRDENGDSRDGVTMQLPDEIRALSYVELETGRVGSNILPYDRYKLSVSNPLFSVTSDGKVNVDVPENVRFLECDLTITYLHGKMAFSNYDMSVTLPLVWTDLTTAELKEYYTASVRVGNDADGYDTVWSKKLLKQQPFDLPDTETVKDLIHWDNSKYIMDAEYNGYGSQQLTNLTVIENTNYDFKINYPTYKLTVTGIEREDGTFYEDYFYAKFGKTFDFSRLKNTGAKIPGFKYNKFAGVADINVLVNGQLETIDLSEPIDAKTAQLLASGTVTAAANYVDNSVKAVFSFSGITSEDVVVKLEKGKTPSLAAVQTVVDNTGDEGIAITNITPAVGPIDHTTNFTVTCVKLSGERNTVNFDLQNGLHNNQPTLAPVDKLIGSLLVNLPTEPIMSRTGYDFEGWFTLPKGGALFTNPGENALTQTVPARRYEEVAAPASEEETENAVTPQGPEIPYMLYAQWTPKVFKVTFDLNGGSKLMVKENLTDTVAYDVDLEDEAAREMHVAYDHTFGSGYNYTEGAKNLMALASSGLYGHLPIPYRSANHGFAGWYYDRDGDGVYFEDGELVTEDTPIDFLSDITLKARWKTLVEIQKSVYSFTEESFTYTGADHPAQSQFNGGSGTYRYLDKDGSLQMDYPTDGYTIRYMRQGNATEYESGYPHIAGTYNVFVVRERDNDYAGIEYRYDAIIHIAKANSSFNATPYVKSTHNNAILAGVNISSFTGDGNVQYAVTKSNSPSSRNWVDGASICNLDAGTYYLWARLGEGMNYNASSHTASAQFSITHDTPNAAYVLVIHTAATGDAEGTDANIYAKYGSSSEFVHLDDIHDDDDNEQGDENEHVINCSGNLAPSGNPSSIPVAIKLTKSGSSWHWQPDWFRLDVYETTSTLTNTNHPKISQMTRLITGTQQSNSNEFDENGETKSYNLAIKGRGVNTNSYTLSFSGSTISASSTLSDNYRSNYDPYKYDNAPAFVAYFSNPIFNKYITRTDLYTYTIDYSGLRTAMAEYCITELNLTYGFDYPSSTGVYGAADDLKTVSIS